MKKILLLGGSAQQVIAIETAKKLGYYTVLCDFLSDNPGQYVADKFCLVSTTDKEEILKVAQEEEINGILAYASDPAAPTAAYVAEKMGLPGNPYESVDILCNKDKFRTFLKENGFNTPVAKGYSDINEAEKDIINDYFKLPVIVKPVDSSGSKGATVLYNTNGIKKGMEFAFSFSRNNKIIVEEFIEKDHLYLIGGDIFVVNGEIVLWGLMNCHRDSNVNSLVPVGKSYPLMIEKGRELIIKKELTNLVEKLNIKNCGMNIELIIDKDDKVYFIDVGPRSGGNMIPNLLGDIFNINVVKMSIQAAMGDKIECNSNQNNSCFATYNLHVNANGIFNKIVFETEINKYIYRKCIYKEAGDKVEYFDNASKCIGIIFLKFSDEKIMNTYLNKINELINIKLK